MQMTIIIFNLEVSPTVTINETVLYLYSPEGESSGVTVQRS